MSNQIMTPRFEGAFAHFLIDGDVNDFGKRVYSVRAVFDEFDGWNPEDPKSCPNWAKEAMQAAIKAGKDKKWQNKVPSNLSTPFIDGNTSEKPEFHGKMYVNLKAYESRPPIIDKHGKAMMEISPDQIYSGAQYRAVVQLAPYSHKGKNGISAYIVAVQKCADGERKDGGISESQAESLFGDTTGSAPEDDELFN